VNNHEKLKSKSVFISVIWHIGKKCYSIETKNLA